VPHLPHLLHINMPFSAAQLTAFWTSNAQMGLTARTCTKMATEGLTTPADSEDYAEEADLELLFKTLLKPAKVTVGARLQEVVQYKIPAKLMIHLHGVRKIVKYYGMVGQDIEAVDLSWNVIKSFVEQWKVLLEKKNADVGPPPKLTKDKIVYKWLESFDQYLLDKIGAHYMPLTYMTRTDVATPVNAATVPHAVDEPFAAIYTSIEEEMKICVSHTHNLAKLDNTALFQLIDHAVTGHDASATIAIFCRGQDGCGAFLAIKNQHAGRHIWDKNFKDAMAVLQVRKWTGTTSISLA
jgi:hypothetical protein